MTLSSPRFRSDIEGLRAWAVAGVVLFHLFGVPLGGVAGVDVFFVISGFVISASLLREYERTGTVSLSAFALRRVQRLLPAAVPVMIVSVVVGFFVWYRPRALTVVLDAFAAVTSVANWHFAFRETGYFSTESGISPLQHFWSLAVEEQFYVIWPIVVLVALAAAAGRGTLAARRSVLGVVAAVVVVFGLVYAIWQTGANPDRAYFDTVARSWELGVGAMVALAMPWIDRVPERVAAVLGTVGFSLIVVAMVTIDSASAFPAPGALPAVFGAAIVVAFGRSVRSRGPVGWALSGRPARFVGRLSYSIYLWHFPVHVFARTLVGDGIAVNAAALGLTVVLAWVSYRFIEMPVLSWRGPTAVLVAQRGVAGSRKRRILEATVATVMVTVLVGAVGAQRSSGLQYSGGLLKAFGAPQTQGPGDQFESREDVRDAVRIALDRTSWPSSVQSNVDSVVADVAQDLRECLNWPSSKDAEAQSCSAGYPDASRVAVVVGDSTAAAYSPAVERALVPLGWRVETMTFAGCSALGQLEVATDDLPGASGKGRCAFARERMADFVSSHDPALVVTSASASPFSTDVDHDASVQKWTHSTADGIAAIAAPGRSIVSLTAPPNRQPISECAVKTSGPSVCDADAERGRNVDRNAKFAAERVAIQDARDSGVDVQQVDVTDWFCRDGRCPAVLADTIVMYDATHITSALSVGLGGPMRDVLREYVR